MLISIIFPQWTFIFISYLMDRESFCVPWSGPDGGDRILQGRSIYFCNGRSGGEQLLRWTIIIISRNSTTDDDPWIGFVDNIFLFKSIVIRIV